MEAVLLIEMQTSGKSSHNRDRFFNTHVRTNGDMLRTKDPRRLLVEACLQGQQPYVVDKMNLRAAERERYIATARAAGFRVTGYLLQTRLREAISRNQLRDAARVSRQAIADRQQMEAPRDAAARRGIRRPVRGVDARRWIRRRGVIR